MFGVEFGGLKGEVVLISVVVSNFVLMLVFVVFFCFVEVVVCYLDFG